MKIENAVDFYKTGHGPQYPDNTEFVYSNLTPRSTKYAQTEKITLFSLQRFIGKRLVKNFNEDFFAVPRDVVGKRYERRMNNALGPGVVSPDNILELHDLGYLPLLIKALPEGASVRPGIPMCTVINTLPQFFWLTNYIETMLSCEVWQPITNISVATEYRKILLEAAKATGTPLEFVAWQAHDFSMRGMAGIEAAAASGAAHLASGFFGTDSVGAIDELEDYYFANSDEEMVGGSVVATEHAVMCMGTKEDEIGTIRRLINKNQYGILSIVSDTWNLWKVLTEYAPALHNEIAERLDVLAPNGTVLQPGKLVFRPDSGDPVKIITGYTWADEDSYDGLEDAIHEGAIEVLRTAKGEYFEIELEHDIYGDVITWDVGKELSEHEVRGVVELLWDNFGGAINEAGFKQLEKVGAIYGDSITISRAREIMKRLADKGFASGNVVLGIGSFTYQYNTRDTYGMAVKATWGQVNGIPREIFKDPITDDGTKKSATGLLRVELEDGEYVLYDRQTLEQERGGQLKTVFLDGKQHNLTTLAEVRARVAAND